MSHPVFEIIPYRQSIECLKNTFLAVGEEEVEVLERLPEEE